MINKIKNIWTIETNSISSLTSSSKANELDVLSQDRNSRLQEDIIRYKENNIQWIKWPENNPKVKMRIGKTKRAFDKMEPGRIEIDNNNIFKITIQNWDFLQINNKQIYTDKDKQKELSDLTNKKAVERTEIQDNETLNLGKDYACTFWFMLPKNFPLLANRLVLWQWKQNPKVNNANQNPLLAQRLRKDKLVFTVNNSWDLSGKNWTEPLAELPIKELLGKQIQMKYEFKFSNKEDWYLRIYIDWKKIVDYHWIFSSSSRDPAKRTDEIYFKFGLYRDNYDYGIKLLEEKNKQEVNLDLKQEIADIEKVKLYEKQWNPMTIYFGNYDVQGNTQ